MRDCFAIKFCTAVALTVSSFAAVDTAQGQEWTRFRGPNGAGASEAEGIPVSWTDADYAWRVALPGAGHSAPVLWGDKLFITSADETSATRHLLCLNAADGSVIWQRDFPSSIHPKHTLNSFASSTPTVDADRLYVAWSTPEHYVLRAFNHDGEDVWECDLGPFSGEHSSGTSPMLAGDLVILGAEMGESKSDNTGVESFITGIDRTTGEIRWKTPRKTVFVAYSTPCLYEPQDGDPQLICLSRSHGIASLNPLSGVVNWELEVFDKRTVSSPVVAGDLLLGTCGSGGGGSYVVAMHAPAPGGVPEIAYKVEENAPYVPTPVVYNDLLFLWSDKGIVSCCEVATGELLWRERVGGDYYGSPIRIRDQLYCMSEEGECLVLAASREPAILGRNPLGEGSHSTPSVAGGRLFLRTFSHLLCIEGPQESASVQ